MGILFAPLLGILILLPIVIIGVLSQSNCLAKEKKKFVSEEMSNHDIGTDLSKVTTEEVREVYRMRTFHQWLNQQNPTLKNVEFLTRSSALPEKGEIRVRLFFWDGTKKEFEICIDGLKFFVKSNTPEKDPVSIANEWIEAKKQFLMEKLDKKDGFSLEYTNFPEEKTVYVLIIEKLSELGFIVQEEESLVRFAPV